MRKNNHILTFDNLSKYHIIHGFSTHFLGSMHPRDSEGAQKARKKFAKELGINPEKIIRMGQVHSNTIHFVTEKDCGGVIDKTDGLITESLHVFLGVITADCIPLLFYDPKQKRVAVVHAGWRGLLSEIMKGAVSVMVTKGTDPKDLVVGIGPCIGVCHYDIAKEHAEKLLGKFPDWKPFIASRDDKLFLDLAGVARYQLQSIGILESNIEQANYCTFEQKDLYSYRREGEDFGEMMGVIGLI